MRSALLLTLAVALPSTALAKPPADRPAAKAEAKPEAARPAAKPASKAQPLFEALTKLAGTWTVERDGKTEVSVESRVIAAGSVLHERLLPGAPYEMVNTYHLDGDNLVVTHYCAAGNQPRMQATAESLSTFKPNGPATIVFKFRDGTNLPADKPYMGELTVVIKDDDHVTQTWRTVKDGKAVGEPTVFEHTRKR